MRKTLAVIVALLLLSVIIVGVKRQRGTPPSGEGASSSGSSSEVFVSWQPVNGPGHAWSLKLPSAFSLTFKSETGDSVRYEQDRTTFELVTENAPSLKEYLSVIDGERKTGYEGQPSVTIRKEAAVSVGGHAASEREILLNAAGFSALETYVFVNGNVYQFSTLFTGKDVLNDEDRTLHRNILSTVTFGS